MKKVLVLFAAFVFLTLNQAFAYRATDFSSDAKIIPAINKYGSKVPCNEKYFPSSIGLSATKSKSNPIETPANMKRYFILGFMATGSFSG